MKQDSKYQFIAIEGNIGAGKTTLCKRLSNDWNAKLILEQFSDNPFLPLFYQEPENHAFKVELFFMTERHKQLQNSFNQLDLFKQFTIADYFFIKTLLFANRNLEGNELDLFKRLFHIMNASFPKPDLLVYLHRPVEVLLQNIAKRGREYEQDITADYLLNIQNAYFDYFKSELSVPIVILNLGEKDFSENDKTYNEIQSIIRENYKSGMNMVSI